MGDPSCRCQSVLCPLCGGGAGVVLGTNVTTNAMTAPDSRLQLSLTTFYPLSSIRGKTIKILSILPLITVARWRDDDADKR